MLNAKQIVDEGLLLLEHTQGKEAFPGGQLYIDPDTCINCGACVPECPVSAFYEDEDLAIKAGDEESVHKNYEFFGLKYA